MSTADLDVKDQTTIRAARLEDLPSITAIASSWELDEAARSGSDGFLVSGFDTADYVGLLTRAKYFFVAVQESTIVGFLVGYSDAEIPPDDPGVRQVARELGHVVVIKQVAVARTHVRRGIGRMLYERALGDIGETPVIATVVANPPNVASIRFHYSMGFEPFRTVSGQHGHECVVWLYRNRSQDILMSQYAHGVDLYKHEDHLNWNKLNNLFYISAALFTAYGILITLPNNAPGLDYVDLILFGVCILGISVSLAFEFTLIAGVFYMDSRKAAVARLEDQLVKLGGARVVSVSVEMQGRSSRWLRFSPTRHLLRGVPLLLAAVWILAIGTLLMSLKQ